MELEPTQWRCKQCGQKLQTVPQRCPNCGYHKDKNAKMKVVDGMYQDEQ